MAALQITSDQQQILEQVKSDLKDSFSEGVVQGVTTYLQPFPGYSSLGVPEETSARENLLSMFAAFLKNINTLTYTTLTVLNGYTSGGSLYKTPACYKNFLGEVALEGFLFSPITVSPAYTPLVVLPVGFRPSKICVFPMYRGFSGYGNIYVGMDGSVYFDTSSSPGDSIPLDGIRFRI